MDRTANQQRKSDIDKSKLMIRLLDDPVFKELILDDFITDGTLENAIHGNLENSHTIDELKARQTLHNYIFGIITTGKNLDYNK